MEREAKRTAGGGDLKSGDQRPDPGPNWERAGDVALRLASKLGGGIVPTIQVDTREQIPLPIERFPLEVSTLPVGDYGVRGFSDWASPRFVLERKSLDDLCHSLGKDRDRFFREVEKLRQFRFRALVIEAAEVDIGGGKYRSLIHPASVLGTLDALAVRAGLHVFWCGERNGAARKVESLAEKFCRGLEKDFRALAKASASAGPEGRD